jgi:hypothetical protein
MISPLARKKDRLTLENQVMPVNTKGAAIANSSQGLFRLWRYRRNI